MVGAADGVYVSDTGSWSAREAAAQAEAQYEDAGYHQAQRITTAGAHTDYDIPGIGAEVAALDR